MEILCSLRCKHVEFTERKLSHTGIEITERPSKALRQCPLQASTLPNAAFWEPLGLLQVLHVEHPWTISKLAVCIDTFM